MHLILTHVPIVGAFFVAVTFLWAGIKKDRGVEGFALFTSIGVSLSAIPARYAGMAAEEKIETYSG